MINFDGGFHSLEETICLLCRSCFDCISGDYCSTVELSGKPTSHIRLWKSIMKSSIVSPNCTVPFLRLVYMEKQAEIE